MILLQAQVSVSPDPLVFFFTHSASFVLVCGAVFFILGLIFGRLTWGRYKRQTRALIADADAQKNEIVTLKRKLAEVAARTGAASGLADSGDADASAKPIAKSDPVMASFLATASTILPASEPGAPVIKPSPTAEPPSETAPSPIPLSKLLEVRARPHVLAPVAESVAAITVPEPGSDASPDAPQDTTPSAEPAAKTGGEKNGGSPAPEPASEKTAPAAESPAPPAGEPISPAAADLIKAKRDALRALIEGSRIALPAPVPPPDDEIEGGDLPPHEETPHAPADAPGTTASEEKPAPAASGAEQRLHSDPYLGLIYTSPPAQADDLTHLKGVASVIERRLNELGVYTFKQIALWTEEHVREFSRNLSFKDRIGRERWVEQARELHFQKYNERV